VHKKKKKSRISNGTNRGTVRRKEKEHTHLEYEPDEDKANGQFNMKISGKGKDEKEVLSDGG
jgi:hypothetical protein